MKRGILTACLIFLFIGQAPCDDLTASWYSRESCIKEQLRYYGRITNPRLLMANGKELNDEAFSCASWDYPFGTKLRITNLRNGQSVVVRVTDRGPAKRLYKKGRIIDLSQKAFSLLAPLKQGVISISIKVIKQ